MKSSPWVSVVVLVSVVTLPFALGYGWVLKRTTSDLDRAVAEYRSLGLPFEAGEVVRTAIKPEENAANAIREMREPKGMSEALTKALDLVDAGDIRSAERAWEPVKPFAAQARVTAQFPKVDFKRDWDLGLALQFPEYAILKHGAQALAMEARFKSARGDVSGAVKDLEAAWHLGELAGQEPIFIGLLVRIWCNAITMKGYEACLDQHVNEARQLELLTDSLARLKNPLPDLPYAMRGETYITVSSFRNISLLDAKKIDYANLRISGYPDGYQARAQLRRYLQGRVAFARHPGGNGNPLQAFDDDQATAMDFLSRSRGWPHVEDAGTSDFISADFKCDEVLAQFRVTYGLGQALVIHAKQGKYPTYSNLLDPFGTASPIKILPTKDGVRVYSFGPNRKDDKGRPREVNTIASADDIVASYPPIKRRSSLP